MNIIKIAQDGISCKGCMFDGDRLGCQMPVEPEMFEDIYGNCMDDCGDYIFQEVGGMKNEYGLDVAYFKNKLKYLVLYMDNFTPEELARELGRLASTSHEDALIQDLYIRGVL